MEDRKSHYNKKGLYTGYDKNHKERDALDYYATPIEEVVNILENINLSFENSIILEPCCGGGHMIKGIKDYLIEENIFNTKIIGTDIKDRGYVDNSLILKYEKDFLNDGYVEDLPKIDYIIMNPPYSLIEPFTMKSLGIAEKGVLMLCRLQFLEGKSRYENILKETPPSDIWVYVDRISCYKNGNDKEKMASAQAYCWVYFDIEKIDKKEEYDTKVHWIRRK